MSFLHPEAKRECKKCGHSWFAESYGRLDKQQPLIGQGFTRRAQDLHRQSVHEERVRQYEKFNVCAKCGSKKVKTVRGSESKAKNGWTQIRPGVASPVSTAPVVPIVMPEPEPAARIDPVAPQGPPPGFYFRDGAEAAEWWDGLNWTGHLQGPAPQAGLSAPSPPSVAESWPPPTSGAKLQIPVDASPPPPPPPGPDSN